MPMLKTLLAPLASLKLTVALLVLSMILIYAGTWAQVDTGIWQVQAKYFHSLFCWIDFQTLLPRPKPGQMGIRGGFPMLGGYTIGALLLINLIAAHVVRFKLSARRIGIMTIHVGMIALLVGEGIASRLQQESRMSIEEGSYAVYSEDIREAELAIVEQGAPGQNDVHHIVAAPLLQTGATIRDARLPFDVSIDEYHRNSDFVDAAKRPGKPAIEDRTGTFTVEGRPVTSGTESRSDMPGGFITLSKGQQRFAMMVHVGLRAQTFRTPDNKTYSVGLRFRRFYKPYRIYLKDFAFDRYTGTSMAKNYSSDVRLEDPRHNETREVKISMNNPLRYRGETFFQSSFDSSTEKTTILQVVSNPGWLLPYLAILIAGFGLFDHFLIVLSEFLLRRRLTYQEVLGGHAIVLGLLGLGWIAFVAIGTPGIVATSVVAVSLIAALVIYHVRMRPAAPAAPPTEKRPASVPGKSPRQTVELAPRRRFATAGFLIPVSVTAISALWAISAMRPQTVKSDFDYDAFSKVPISFDGRVQPLDTLARNALKVFRGRETAIKVDPADADKKEYVPASVWLADLWADRPVSRKYKVFRIDHPHIKSLMALDEREKFFSLDDLEKGMEKLEPQLQQVRQAQRANAKDLSEYQRALAELDKQLSLYRRLASLDSLYIVPPTGKDQKDWVSLETATISGASPQAGTGLGELGMEAMRVLGSTPDSQLRHAMAPPARWLVELMAFPEVGRRQPAIRISNSELLAALKLDPVAGFYSVQQVTRERDALASLINGASSAAPESRTPFHVAVLDLAAKMDVVRRLEAIAGGLPPAATAFVRMSQAYAEQRPADFNRAIADYAKLMKPGLVDLPKSRFERWYNGFAPLDLSMWLYVGVFLFAVLSWLGWSRPLARTAFWLLCLTLVLHSFGLLARMYISGRPPVTNLASSAIFIGWGAAIVAAVLEVIFRNGIGSVAAAVIGFPTLLIARQLSLSGDTMAVLQAVLDTNVWLTTHVITITLGYAATFLAGILGIVYIITGVFTEQLKAPQNYRYEDDLYSVQEKPAAADGPSVGKTLARMIYGVTCFAIVCSFIGTILGGIWADQSWGRFWGWDPKENGAVLIVLANAIVLHARWAGIVRERGLANLAIVGNIVTSWSWFGTNMLGVGLHAYGFMDAALMWLLIFVASQLLLIGIGLIPREYWRSYDGPQQPPPAPPKTLQQSGRSGV